THKKSMKAFCRALRSHRKFLLTCHVTPEGDAIGSILALDSILRRMGKKTAIVCEDPIPKRLTCLYSGRWATLKNFKKSPSDFDAVMLADCPTLARIGKVRKLIRPGMKIFNVDHHVSNHLFGDYNCVRPHAAATGEVIMDILEYLRMNPTRAEAENIYAAISTDTGSFKYSNTTIRSHQIACRLLRTGIDSEKMNEEIYSTYSLRKLNLYGRLLRRVKTASGERVAWVTMRRDDLRKAGAAYEDAEGFIDFLRHLKEVQIAFFAMELPDSSGIRVSFRTKGAYDASRIATHFHGGGHKKAAGCVMPGPLAKAERAILARVRKEL
ncbi:MAG: hypothetical protein A2Z83_00905, partial [Omnitrophica bacterium GWA2_52_8]